ncbi:MAG: SMC-Scp complex subunit ScpB [bacterium]|nr:SMC-Scp complex subunit ScpB [bacterium]
MFEGIVEGILYVQGDEGITISELKKVLNINEEKIKDIIFSLKKNYALENRGFRIVCFGDTLKLATKPEHKHYYENLVTDCFRNLSQASLETLAIIAYNQPITRVAIDELRGVSSVFVLRKLLARNLIKEVGRSDLPGRPLLYKTTDDFLDYFGISSLDELPIINTDTVKEEEKDLFVSNYKEECL